MLRLLLPLWIVGFTLRHSIQTPAISTSTLVPLMLLSCTLIFGFWILPLWLTPLYHPLRSVDTVTPPLSQGKELYKRGSLHKEQRETKRRGRDNGSCRKRVGMTGLFILCLFLYIVMDSWSFLGALWSPWLTIKACLLLWLSYKSLIQSRINGPPWIPLLLPTMSCRRQDLITLQP